MKVVKWFDFSRIEEVFDVNPICFGQHLEWNNLEENVGIPHAPSQDLETQKDQQSDRHC